jgi:hypothetical protein
MKSTERVFFTPLGKKVAALELVNKSVPPPYCANAKDPDVVTVAVPAVIVQTPAPRL